MSLLTPRERNPYQYNSLCGASVDDEAVSNGVERVKAAGRVGEELIREGVLLMRFTCTFIFYVQQYYLFYLIQYIHRSWNHPNTHQKCFLCGSGWECTRASGKAGSWVT